jgi:hypothetical protein
MAKNSFDANMRSHRHYAYYPFRIYIFIHSANIIRNTHFLISLKSSRDFVKETLTVTILFVLLIFSFQVANGHKPLEVANNGNNDFSTAKEIPNHRISWAIYEELSGNNRIHYYKFNADKGERLYAQISIPKIEKFSNFSPSITLVGSSNLSASNLEGGHFSVREYSHDLGDLPFTIPPGMRTLVVDYNGPIPSTEFYEPFTQTSYWERQEIILNSLPSSGTYYLVVFESSPMQDVGKYTLAVGEIEDFSPLDFITIIPFAWFNTKLFFEDYLSPTIAISLLVTMLMIAIILTVKRAKRRKNEPKILHHQ